VLALILIIAGVIWHGVTLETLQRLWLDLVERPRGPMTLRFIMQPAMAAIAAFHDGMKDARSGSSPYFWTIINRPQERTARLREGLNSTARLILMGVGMDTIYQYKMFDTFYPVEALDIAVLLAFVPYLLMRGAVTRIALHVRKQSS
jgi:hypothetical protein